MVPPPARAGSPLRTDLYQLTMACAYWKAGLAEREACFHLFFRRAPFGGGYAIAAGLRDALAYLGAWRFADDDLGYLSGLRAPSGAPLFDEAFLAHLATVRFEGDVLAVPEGTVVFANEPLLRVTGPLLAAQIVETALLNTLNFQTLVATKAARVCRAAAGAPVLEFGLRRAQGPDGGASASRAAYLGGCAATSNVLAGRLEGIPVQGTHAHSFITCFATELEAFEAWAQAMPDSQVFLVDTYDTLDGVRNAVTVGRRMAARGRAMIGVRLDSGDLGALAVQARRILDEGGLPDAKIVASNDLDEHAIEALRARGAPIDVWGVGTRLATAYDQPALGGVYKLAALQDERGEWTPRIKLSEQAIKISTPGLLRARRCVVNGRPVADVVYDERRPPEPGGAIVTPDGPRRIDAGATLEELLEPVMVRGEVVTRPPPLSASRDRALAQVAAFDPAVVRNRDPEPYPVGLEEGLDRDKRRLVAEAR